MSEENKAMSENDKQLWKSRSEIIAELTALEGKNDPESNDRSAGLMDELMTIDSCGLGQFRRDMANGKFKRESDSKPEAKPEQPSKSASQRLREAGVEVIINQELQNSGGLTIIGAKMPKPKPTPPEDQPPP